jgi:hypothetical protein
MLTKNLLIFLILLIEFFGLRAQTTQAHEFVPAILPQSPEAASFSKFGNYDVNLFTGVPIIGIPIYEIKVGEITVPIGINYHASGIKVTDWGSWVGLGFSLDAGGSISRRIMGQPDDQASNYLSGVHPVKDVSTLNLATDSDLYYVRMIQEGIYDGEPDIFSYNFYGKSGQFVFNQNNGYKPIIIPYDPITISLSGGQFDINDERGVNYQFHDGEYSKFFDVNTTIQGTSTWVLTSIISANKQDTVSFSYTMRSGQVDADIRDLIILNDNVYNNPPYQDYTSDLGTAYTDNISTTVSERKIQQITFPNGKVVFDASVSDRLDAFTGQKSLSDIKIYSLDKSSGSYIILKTVNLYQSYFVNSVDNSKRLRLDSLAICDNGGNVIEKYKFNYNTSVQLPDKPSRARDYWGYYNGKQNNTLVPQNTQVPWQSTTSSTSSNITIGSTIANGREPDSSYMQAYMLQRIYFPTGGYTDFEYETNKYLQPPYTIKYAGGLRIKSIKSYDGTNPNPIIKNYRYGSAECGYGRANFKLGNYFFQTTQNNQYFTRQAGGGCDLLTDTKRVRVFSSSPSIEIEPYDGSPVAYDTVSEYVGDPTTNVGKTIFIYNDHPDVLNTTMMTGKPVLTTYFEHRGQVIDKLVYSNTGHGYQLIEETQNIYTYFPEAFTYNLGIVASKTLVSDSYLGFDVALPSYNNRGACNYSDTYNFQYVNYAIRTDDNRLTQTKKIMYDQNNPAISLVSTTNFYYDNLANLQVTRVYTVNSLGDSIKIFRKYPHDYSASAPYSTMVSRNNINKIIQETKYKAATQLTQQTNNYADMGNGNYLTDSVTLQISSNPVETRANFTSYDPRGNILEMQKTRDMKLSYIWDYQKFYPVAEVKNAAQNQIAYTSFESNGTGNWSFSNPIFSPEGITGNQSFILNSTNSISYYFLNGGINFIISYWSKDGQLTIGGVTVVTSATGITKNGWTYYESIITANTGNNLTLTASSGKTIDELRLYPAGALMTTRTYSPLIGMTSQCSENNTVTYYIYDKYGRLKFVKDADGNILKTTEYHYQGNSNTGL